MTTKQELLDEQERLKQQLNKLSEKIDNCDKPKTFPQEGDMYWYYENNGYVASTIAVDSEGRLEAYKTKKEAQKARDIVFAKQRIAQAIEILNDGWKPDWSSYSQYKYCMYKNTYSNTFDITTVVQSKIQLNYMYCKTYDIAEQIVSSHTEDLLLILSE